MEDIYIFRRVEKKYLVSGAQKAKLLKQVGHRLVPDEHGQSTICSLYLDTPDHRLIRNSIDAKAYKEKLRLRSYGTPGADTAVFLELKKKYDGVVYKRRVSMPLRQAERYLACGKAPLEGQIMREIDYAMGFYGWPQPAMMIAYEREAFAVKDVPQLRLTFDGAVRYRDRGLAMMSGTAGKVILPEDTFILEVKTGGAMPLWLSHALDESGIRPASFSKYGTAYLDTLKAPAEVVEQKGENKHAINF